MPDDPNNAANPIGKSGRPHAGHGDRPTDRRSDRLTGDTDRTGQWSDPEAPNGGASRRVWTPSPRPAPNGAGQDAPGVASSHGPGVPQETWFAQRLRRRRREKTPRTNRVSPRFSDTEWAALTRAADANKAAPGSFVAAAAVLAAGYDDPRAAVADFHGGIRRLGQATTELARIGNLLNQTVRYLHQGGALYAQHQHLLDRVERAIDTVETSATTLVRE